MQAGTAEAAGEPGEKLGPAEARVARGERRPVALDAGPRG